MAEKMKDDVDRLFSCFKCGISPPQSATRVEWKREKKRSLALASGRDVGPCSLGFSPEAVTNVANSDAEHTKNEGEIIATSSGHSDKIVSGNGKSFGLKGKNQISPTVFYGSPLGIPPKRPVSLIRLLREIHADLAQQDNVATGLREGVWVTFPRQNEAMNFAKEHGGNVRLFSYQDHHNAQRRFLVSTYHEFWKRYKIMNPNLRHHYEVIQENLPCHLYFDLEFSRKDNPTNNGDEMVNVLLSIVFEVLLEKYSINGNEDWVIELDSSTSEKFSRHLIIGIPKIAFKDNSHAGAFVSEVSSRITNSKQSSPLLQKLFIKKDTNVPASYNFIDTAVYSRNRCFRLAFSSKAGKTAILLPTGRFKSKNMSEEELFMASLICSMDKDCTKLLVCKMDPDCVKRLQFDTELNYDLSKYRSPYLLPATGSSNEGRSPFPDLDNFVESIASYESESGKIRSWYWLSELELIVYSMSRNRYCERIGREHKSNHVIYVVDLKRRIFYQKCHDPDCQGYRSPFRPIPLHMILDASQFGPSKAQSNYQFEKTCGDDDSPRTTCNDSWWLEVIRVADTMEMRKQSDVDIDEDDEGWWSSVESYLSQAELV